MSKNLIMVGVAIVLITAFFVFINSDASSGSNKTGTASVVNATNGTNQLLDSQEFISKYKSMPDSILIDVRTPAEFNSSNISSSINIDYENPSFVSEINNLDKTKSYFIYCRSGNRSARAHRIMKDAGIENIYELKGGIVAGPELLK